MEKACCAFGHREVFENISKAISSAVRTAAEQGCEIFYTGAMGRFDEMFSSEVRTLKKDYPNIKLICVMPYMTNEINIQRSDLVIVYTKRNYGGAYNAKRYAQRLKKAIITI